MNTPPQTLIDKTTSTEQSLPMVSVTVDGHAVSVPTGSTILQAAQAVEKNVPTLCYSSKTKAHGACRVCMVEVEGRRPMAACHSPVAEGMKVTTQSPFLQKLRYNITELIVSDHPLDCLTCPANGRCELQDLASEVGLRDIRFDHPEQHTPPKDFSHPFIKADMEKCIMCHRCVRVCDELQGSFILGVEGRGYNSKIIMGNDSGFEEAGCVSCGACVVECPVAALEEPGTREAGVPEKTVTTTCTYCGVGCSLQVNVTADRVTHILPNPEGSSNEGHTCVKGRFAHQFVHSKDRLTSPLIKENGSFREASWDEALSYVAQRLTKIRDQHGPDGFASISSARCTNEEGFLMQKFTRTVMGTNSVDNCSRVCHSPSAFALNKSLGTGAGTNSFQDIDVTDCILLVGANPTEAHPVAGARMKQAVLRGAKLIVVDPRNTELTRYADVHLPVRPGSNVALINAMGHVIVEEGWVKPEFIDQYTEGYQEIKNFLADYSPEQVEDITGVPPNLVRQAAKIYAQSGASMICWGLGVTEAAHGTNTVFGMINMALMTGQIGRPGTGTNPLRGQNNVQGVSDMGAIPNVFSDYRPVTDPQARAEHEKIWGVTPPTNTGLTIPNMIDAAIAGSLKAMWIIAKDIAQSDPNMEHIKAGLNSLDFLVVQDIFMCETAKLADVVFPGASFLEKNGTFVNSDRRIQRVRPALDPVPGCKIDGHIINEVAKAMGADLGFGDIPDPSKVMDEIAQLSPNWRGVDYQRLEELGFIQWPCTSKSDPGTDIVHRDGQFLGGKAKFKETPWQEPGELPDDEYPFFLTTGRQLFHYNVGTMTRRTAVSELTKGQKETLRIHPKDAKRMAIQNGDRIKVTSRRGSVEVDAEITKSTNPGTLYMTFHFPETKTNILVSSAADEYTQCPEYKVVAVRIEKVGATVST